MGHLGRHLDVHVRKQPCLNGVVMGVIIDDEEDEDSLDQALQIDHW